MGFLGFHHGLTHTLQIYPGWKEQRLTTRGNGGRGNERGNRKNILVGGLIILKKCFERECVTRVCIERVCCAKV